jgi:hypothetical protein
MQKILFSLKDNEREIDIKNNNIFYAIVFTIIKRMHKLI